MWFVHQFYLFEFHIVIGCCCGIDHRPLISVIFSFLFFSNPLMSVFDFICYGSLAPIDRYRRLIRIFRNEIYEGSPPCLIRLNWPVKTRRERLTFLLKPVSKKIHVRSYFRPPNSNSFTTFSLSLSQTVPLIRCI